jgi:hypothetical protein
MDVQRTGMGAQKSVGLTLGVAGAVGLGLGGVFGLLTASAWNRAKSACGGNPSQCTSVASGQADRSTAVTDATISTVSFVAGGALLEAGLILFFTAGSAGRPAKTGWTLAPAVGPRQAAVTLEAAF